MLTVRTFGRVAAAVLVAVAAVVATTTPAAAQPAVVADVELDLTASSPLLSRSVVLRVVVTNDGPDASSAAGGAFIEWPRSYGLGTPTVPADCQRADGATLVALSCSLGALAPGERRTFTVRVPVGLLASNSELRFNAQTVFLAPNEPNPANNYDVETCRALTSLLVRC